ncbi:unnamed protein product [Symbiodinium pilosum]|uniref:Uncharacterized protein n=1 Tax=Symbiodinium pilosum TaxID=2952 RepID=A0A812Q9Z4_SYMPI|nr:unnamed protein product [Symbiodinium pilosum]
MLRRAVEVADAYFPPDAGLSRRTLLSAMWQIFPQVQNAKSAAARTHFELQNFDEALAMASAVLQASSTADAQTNASLIQGAVQVVTGRGKAVSFDELSSPDAKCIACLNEIVGETVTDEGSGAPPTASRLEDSPLAGIVGLREDDIEISAPSRLVLRCTLGELAARGGVDEPWVRQALVAALQDFDTVQPTDPTLRPLVFRALTALAAVTNQKGDAITAEGLFHTALDHAGKYKIPGQRAQTWRSWVSEGFAKMLSEGRHAEQRKKEIEALQAEVGDSSLAVQRWALLYVPPPVLSGGLLVTQMLTFASLAQKPHVILEGSHALQNLHRDWKETSLVDTCIAGCVGRKRAWLAPDEVTPREGDSSRPALDLGWLRPLRGLPNEDAWQAMEAHAQNPNVCGGAMDITPGMFVFIPHGWWHALRPLDDVTVITGPSKLSHHYHTEEAGTT